MAVQRIVILSGAGISQESGIATFRDQDGLWENHRIEDVASPLGFAKNPKLVFFLILKNYFFLSKFNSIIHFSRA